MKIELLSKTKNKDISISNEVFSKEFNESLIHQAVISFMSSSRQGSAKQKNRSEVRGGGKKPYRQKGTGRARAGTIRSPLWRGGGVTFASRPRDFSKKINKDYDTGFLIATHDERLCDIADKILYLDNCKLFKRDS